MQNDCTIYIVHLSTVPAHPLSVLNDMHQRSKIAEKGILRRSVKMEKKG